MVLAKPKTSPRLLLLADGFGGPRNPWLLATSLAESSLAAVAVYIALRSFDLPPDACVPLAMLTVVDAKP